MTEVRKTYGSKAEVRVIYAPSTAGALAYADEPAYRSTRLAAAQPQRKNLPAAVPAPKPGKIAAPQPKARRVPLSQLLRANHVGAKAFIFACVGIAALMGLMMIFNCKTVSDAQCEINKAAESIEEMNLRLGEIDMNCRCSFDLTAARLAAEKANMIRKPVPGI